MAVNESRRERKPWRKLGCGDLLGFGGTLERLVPVAEQVEDADRAGQEVGLPRAVADSPGQLESAVDDCLLLAPAVELPERRGEVVVGPEPSGMQVVLERDHERALDQDQRLPRALSPRS